MKIAHEIIEATAEFKKTHMEKPTKVFVDLKGMHDLYLWINSVPGVCYRDLKLESPGLLVLGLHVEFDYLASTPRVE